MSQFAPGSYRDRDARVIIDREGNIWRGLSQNSWDEWSRFAQSPLMRRLMQDSKIISTTTVPKSPSIPAEVASDPWAGYLRHARIPLITYPFEWSFGMLQQAARLHLELLQSLLVENLTLKDGTAYNVQFQGVEPVFIDLGSLEALDATRPWAGYRQFCQTMLFPLMMQAYKNIPFQPWLRGRLDGITPTECSQMMSFRDLFRRGVWSHVRLHAWLDASAVTSQKATTEQVQASGFQRDMLAANFKNLSRVIEGLDWKAARSEWSEYEGSHSYSPEDRRIKEEFVRRHLSRQPRQQVWDMGCNTGTFSRIAAEHAELVIAMDADHLSVERLFRSLRSETSELRRKIVPLVWNVADQAGGLGWKGMERPSLIERGKPDFILGLAIIHHLVIGCGIPLTELLEWLAGLGAELIIEFVDPSDPMAASLLERRRGPCSDYCWEHFHAEMNRLFEIRDTQTLRGGQRTLIQAAPRRLS